MAIMINTDDYSREKLKELEEILTYSYSNPFGKDETLFAWKQTGPNSLNIPYTIARKYLKLKPTPRKKTDNRWQFLFNLRTDANNNQQELDDQAFPILKERGSVCLFLPCSWGKTIQSISMAARLDTGGKVAVISSFTILTGIKNGKLGQWNDAFAECSNAKVFFLRKPTKTKTWEKEQNEANILIGMPSSIKHMIKKEVDVLILDEAHTLCTESFVEQVLEICPKYVIILTATPDRDNEMETFLYSIGGGKKQHFSRESKKPFKVFPLITGFGDQDVDFGEEPEETVYSDDEDEPKKKKSFYDIQKKIKENMRKGITRVNLESKLAFLKERNKEIIDLIEFVVTHTKFKIAVVGDRVDQLQYIYDECIERDIDVAGLWGKRQTVENSQVLVLGVKRAGTGFDEKTFIENWNGKRIDLMLFTISTYKIIQTLGRALRASRPCIVQMLDKDQKRWFRKTWNDNITVYEKMLGEVQKECNWKTIRERLLVEDEIKRNEQTTK